MNIREVSSNPKPTLNTTSKPVLPHVHKEPADVFVSTIGLHFVQNQ